MHWHIATVRQNDPATYDAHVAMSFGSLDAALDELRYQRNRDDCEPERFVVECHRAHRHQIKQGRVVIA